MKPQRALSLAGGLLSPLLGIFSWLLCGRWGAFSPPSAQRGAMCESGSTCLEIGRAHRGSTMACASATWRRRACRARRVRVTSSSAPQRHQGLQRRRRGGGFQPVRAVGHQDRELGIEWTRPALVTVLGAGEVYDYCGASLCNFLFAQPRTHLGRAVSTERLAQVGRTVPRSLLDSVRLHGACAGVSMRRWPHLAAQRASQRMLLPRLRRVSLFGQGEAGSLVRSAGRQRVTDRVLARQPPGAMGRTQRP